MTIQRIEIDGDKEIWVEVTEVTEDETSGRGRLQPASRSSERVAAETTQTFEDAVDRVAVVAEKIHSALDKLVAKPERVSVEFGVKFSAEAGVILAKGGIDANLKVTLCWSTATATPALD